MNFAFFSELQGFVEESLDAAIKLGGFVLSFIGGSGMMIFC